MLTQKRALWTTKTFYVGLLAVAAGIIEGLFDEDWSSAVEKILAGLLMITGRSALQKME